MISANPDPFYNLVALVKLACLSSLHVFHCRMEKYEYIPQEDAGRLLWDNPWTEFSPD